MPLRPPSPPPTDQRSWDQWARQVAVVPDDGSVNTLTVADKAITNVKLRDSSPASVIGRVASTSGPPADIISSADGFLVNRGGTLGFGVIGDSDIPGSITRDSELTATITALQAATDPFTQYILKSTVLNASVTYDPPSLGDGAGTTTTVTVTGAALGDFALASFSLDLQGMTLTAYVSAVNTVSVRVQNESGGTLDLASGTLRVRVWKQ